MLSARAQRVWQLALLTAKGLNHTFVTTEHLLLALLNDTQVQSLITTCGASVLDTLHTTLSLQSLAPFPQMSHCQTPQTSEHTRRLMNRVIQLVDSVGAHYVQVGHLVLGILTDDKMSPASHVLAQQGLTPQAILRHISLSPQVFGAQREPHPSPTARAPTQARRLLQGASAFGTFGINKVGPQC